MILHYYSVIIITIIIIIIIGSSSSSSITNRLGNCLVIINNTEQNYLSLLGYWQMYTEVLSTLYDMYIVF